MENKMALFSMMKNEPQSILNKRLEALLKLPKNSYDSNWVMESYDERDERGFGVLANLADNNVNICQYGVLTTFEQLSPEQLNAGIVVCDIFDAMHQYDLTKYWDKLSFKHQAFTNSGVFVYVPSGKSVDVTCYFVQDNSVDEIMIKSVLIVKEKEAQVRFNQIDLSFGKRDNIASIEVVEIDKIT